MFFKLRFFFLATISILPIINMKVICVGLPKTGTKSICSALRTLNMNVYDFEEQVWYLGDQLKEILDEGTITNNQIVKMFEGVDATTDFPCSFIWEKLAEVFPDAKVY